MIAGVLLAAGRSSRFGADKLCAPLNGSPVVSLSIRALADVDELLVIVGPKGSACRAALSGAGARFVTNPDADEGMASSIRAAVRSVSPTAEAMILALGDQPFASAAVTRALIAAWREGGADIVVPMYTDGRGHPVLFGRACFEALGALQGDVGARSVTELTHFRVTWLPVAEVSPVDVDTPEALALAAGRAADDASISPPSV